MSAYIFFGVLGVFAVVNGIKGLHDHAIVADSRNMSVNLTGGDATFYSWASVVVGGAFAALAIAGLISRSTGGQG